MPSPLVCLCSTCSTTPENVNSTQLIFLSLPRNHHCTTCRIQTTIIITITASTPTLFFGCTLLHPALVAFIYLRHAFPIHGIKHASSRDVTSNHACFRTHRSTGRRDVRSNADDYQLNCRADTVCCLTSASIRSAGGIHQPAASIPNVPTDTTCVRMERSSDTISKSQASAASSVRHAAGIE